MKTCTVCKIEKSIECFTKSKATCKTCRANNSKDNRTQTRIAEREIKRNEFFKHIEKMCRDEGTEFDYKEIFLKEEVLEAMKLKLDLYSWCDVPEQIAEKVRLTDDYINGYVLKHIFISDKIRKTAYTRLII